MGTSITYKCPDGTMASGYLANAAKPNAPGIVVIQEWWGVQEQIKGMADRLALAGYDALAPSLYAGKVVPYHDREAAAKEMASLNYLESTDNVVRGAAQYLGRNGAKVAITGCCLGGAITIIAAGRIPELAAAICFYGIPPAQIAGPADVKIPFQGHFAVRDDWCTPAAVDALEAGLEKTGQPAVIYRYDADHGFVNEQRPEVHDRAVAELAWGRMLEFCQMHLA
jgi:carboxymethylenebutenolidase